jgi:type II secretory pathway pseudopilin PulG
MRSRTASPSFTLVEILAATAVLSVLFTIMFGILQQTSAGWQAANRRVEASQVARLALDQIAADLENCVAVAGTWNLPAGTTNYAFGFAHSNGPSGTFPSATGVSYSPPNDSIAVVTPYFSSRTTGQGDLYEVGYDSVFVDRVDGYSTMRGRRHYLLRYTSLSNQAGNAVFVNDFLSNSNGWGTTPPGITTVLRLPFIDNCLKFNVEFFYTNASGVLLTNAAWGRPAVGGWTGNPAGAVGLPLGAVIQLCVVDDRTAERLSRLNGGSALSPVVISNLPTNWNAVPANLRTTLQSSVMTFQRRIYFKNLVQGP